MVKRGFQVPAQRRHGFPALLELVHKDGLALGELARHGRDVVLPLEEQMFVMGDTFPQCIGRVVSVRMPENLGRVK